MKIDKPEAVANIVYYLREADRPRSVNRALIDSLFNGDAPWTDSEAEENGINTNVNFLDAARIAHDARNTFNNGFLKPGNFFNVGYDSGPVYKKNTWARETTQLINKYMKRSKPYMESLRAEFAQTVLHGVGPSFWRDKSSWCPCPVEIDDLMIPSRTKVSMENLDYFAIYRQYTPNQLYRMTHGKKLDPGWDMKYVDRLLKKYEDEYLVNQGFNVNTTPEKIEAAIKSDIRFYDNEAIPTINCWDVFIKNDESDNEEWHRRMIVDYQEEAEMAGGFLYAPKRIFSDELSHILHVMFADGSNVAPFRYHSVRGLGWLLYAVCHLQNRLRCKFNDSVFEQMLWYFRVSSPEDREKLNKIDLHHLGILPEGMDFVKSQERYTPNMGIINEAFALNRQSMAESSAQFRQDINDGTQKEMTAAETMARVNSANAMVGSMLNLAYTYQNYQYKEICRRFCRKDSLDKDVKAFQDEFKKAGIPSEFLDVERWNIEPERVLGSGNKTLEIAQVKELMAARPLFDPEPQRMILHMFTEAMTDDPKMAENLVPVDKKQISDAVHDAQLAFGSLMMGAPVAIKTGINHIEYIEAMIFSMSTILKRIEQTTNTATPAELIGLQNVSQHIAEHIAILAQDKAEKERVKRYNDAMSNFNNLIKALGQRLQEQQQQQGGGIDPQTQAKIQGQLLIAQTNAQIKEANAAQRRQQKDADFQSKQARDAQAHTIDMGKEVQDAQVKALAVDAQTAAKIRSIKHTQENNVTNE